MPTLTTPSVLEAHWSTDRLFSRYSIHRGVTLAVSGETVSAIQYPLQEDLEHYDRVYMGGQIYEITQAEADVLTAAGWGEYIT